MLPYITICYIDSMLAIGGQIPDSPPPQQVVWQIRLTAQKIQWFLWSATFLKQNIYITIM